MIIYSQLNYRMLDQRLRRLEKRWSEGSGPPTYADLRNASQILLKRIPQLPAESAANAQRLLDEERRYLALAAEEKCKVEGDDWSVYEKAMRLMHRRLWLARYLDRGRILQAYSDAALIRIRDRPRSVRSKVYCFVQVELELRGIQAESVEENSSGIPKKRYRAHSPEGLRMWFLSMQRRIDEIDQLKSEEEWLAEEASDDTEAGVADETEAGVAAAPTDDTQN